MNHKLDKNSFQSKPDKYERPSVYTVYEESEITVNDYCVIPENIHTSPTEGIFSNSLPPQTKLYTFL